MKKLLKFMLALVVVGSMAACSSNEPQQGGDEAKPVEFSIWHTFTKDQEQLLNDLADEFEAAHEGVTINVVGGYDAGEFNGTVTSAVTNDVGPQLIFQYTSFAKSFDGYDILLPLSDYWNFDLADLCPAGYIEEASAFADGKIYTAPIQTTGPVLFYNKTIYDSLGLKAPRTWEDLKVASKKIHDELGIVGFGCDGKLTDLAQIFIYQSHDGAYVDLENNKVLWNDDKTVEWINYWAEGVKEGYFQLKAQAADGYTSGDINSQLVGAYMGSSAGLPYLRPAENGWEVGVTTVPVIDENSVEVVNWNRSAIAFKTDNEATNQAIADFVAYFIEQDARWAKVLNAYSPYYAVQEQAEYQEYVSKDIALIALGQQLANGLVPPTFTGGDVMREELHTVFSGVLADGYDAATALNTAAINSEAAMNE